jgi:hypothetical protein
VVDAAGAIYVIGGIDVIGGTTGGPYFADVWASTDGGARPDSVEREGGQGVLERVLWGTLGYLWGY